MPESVVDRPTKSHEYIFLLSKSERYYYDAEAIKEPANGTAHKRGKGIHPKTAKPGKGIKQNSSWESSCTELVATRNKRTVWNINTSPYRGTHFATFPPELPEICIKAGTGEKALVLDPFFGAGTVGVVAKKLGRHYLGIELNGDYCKMAEKRIEECYVP